MITEDKKKKDELKKFLVCESFKKIDGSYLELLLLPLCNDQRYGVLFLGAEFDEECYTRDITDRVWRITEDGKIEYAIMTENFDNLQFRQSEYDICTGMEDNTLFEVFGMDLKKIEPLLEKYKGRTGRIQRFVSKHPIRELIRGRILNVDRQKIAAVCLAGTLVITSGYLAIEVDNYIKQSQMPVFKVSETKIPEVTPVTTEAVITQAPIVTELPKAAPKATTEPTVEKQEEYEYSAEFDEYVKSILSKIESLNSPNFGIIETDEYKFYKKYSSTLNDELENYNKGEINSIEVLLDAYKSDPVRFATYGRMFLQKMSLDYMKVQYAKVYDISPEKLTVTFEPKSAIVFECAVKNKATDEYIEVPAFWGRKDEYAQGLTGITKLNQGSRNSALTISDWENHIGLYELSSYSSGHVSRGDYTISEYNNILFEYVKVLDKNLDKMYGEASRQLTWEEEER